MSAEAEPTCWPESIDEREDEESRFAVRRTGRRIVHFRHRIGEYDVTRLILESTNGARVRDE